MVEQSKAGDVGTRFGTYVEELREFFKSRAIRYGSPQDLPAFAERVTVPGPFQDEMGSLVRSIFFQESENLGRAELLEIVTVAVAGPQMEAGTQGMQSSVRDVFMFVNGALRQSSGLGPAEPEALEEPQVTAGDILAAPYALKRREEAVLPARSPQDGSREGGNPKEGRPVNAEVARGVPVRSGGVLFKAVSAAAEDDDLNLYRPAPRSNRWVVPAVIAGVIAVGLGGYSLRTVTSSPSGTVAGSGTGAPLPQPVAGALSGSCVNAPSSSVSRANLQERGRWARNLLDQKLYEAALPELRNLAKLDPGFPGVNLDESTALMQLKRPEDAREAVNTQIALSECLSKLPSAALDSYCSTEFTPSTVGGCRQQLAHIRESAELQAALVHLELGHRVAPEAAAAVSSAAILGSSNSHVATPEARTHTSTAPSAAGVRRVPPLPPASDGDARPAPMPAVSRARVSPATRPATRKSSADDSLVHGDGTDSAYGAYSKPQ